MKKLQKVLVLLICTFLIPPALMAQEKLLGKIDFPNSGSPAAQTDFIQGVLFLHNFEYADAARSFRRAQNKDADFALAYWGEAMTYNHPIWMDQDPVQANAVLTRLGNTFAERKEKAVTQREKDYLMTLEILYGFTQESENKSKEARDFLYMNAMKNLHASYPNDHEALAFYGLSILGTAHAGRDFAIYMRAAAELFEIWNQNPLHPGAAHYLIHSFDDPIHAPLGLPMAKSYSEIAPAAAHAQHMTSHIFLALGMWDDVVDANIVARRVQQNRQRELNEKISVCGHYTWWLQYGYLQRGEAVESEQILQTCKERIEENNPGSNLFGERWHYSVMMSHQIIDTEDWQSIRKWRQSFSTENADGKNYYYTSAFAELKIGNHTAASDYLSDLKNMNVSNLYDEDRERNIQVMQIESLFLFENGENEKALDLLEQAAIMESELPVSFGPPTIAKPSYELLGDQLFALGKYKESADAYETQLIRTPNRLRSVEGKKLSLNSIFE